MHATPDVHRLPEGLPRPVDDGAADHLRDMRAPALTLCATSDGLVDLSTLAGRTIVYVYPRTGEPDRATPAAWDQIPGARGCTPQSCAFRDHHAELEELGARLFGLSTQGTAYQREVKERLHLPFDLLSDEHLALTNALRLPTFTFDAETLLKRLTLVLTDGVVEKVFYPVFPPDENAAEVIAWLSAHPR